MKIISMTCVCVDVFDGKNEIRAGGEALNFSANISKFDGVEPYIIGAVGNDHYGRFLLDEAKRFPINLTNLHIHEGETASNITYLTPDGDRYYKENSWTSGVYGDFVLSDEDISLMQSADWVHTSVYCPNLQEILKLKATCGFKLAIDFNTVSDLENRLEIIKNADVMFVSASDELLKKLEELSHSLDTILVGTLAERGSVAYHKGIEYRCEAVKVSEVIDTTGCGDSYQAGFLAVYSQDGDILSAMQKGSKIASVTLSHLGGF